jgi:hypothetical protein
MLLSATYAAKLCRTNVHDGAVKTCSYQHPLKCSRLFDFLQAPTNVIPYSTRITPLDMANNTQHLLHQNQPLRLVSYMKQLKAS